MEKQGIRLRINLIKAALPDYACVRYRSIVVFLRHHLFFDSYYSVIAIV